MQSPVNLLFICSRNQWRSPTAEKIWQDDPNYRTRSAGVSPAAKRTVGVADIHWANFIFVMEKKHKTRLVAQFSQILDYKAIHILDIPDEYQFMDQELIEELKVKVGAILSGR